ncbi:MAG TPA: response regulator [Burkholderiaceae bacterium]
MSSPPLSPPRVLVVDDGLLNIEIATHLLTEAGMQVATALDGSGVLAQVAAFAPDIVLMDIQLPGLDGLTLTQQLRSQASTRALVIVAFTAYAMKGDREKFLAGGCDAYISKPIDVDTFADEVRALLPAR